MESGSMPELLDGVIERKLAPGDVVMVARKMRDKTTNRRSTGSSSWS
jgi:hypothetical protein